MDIYNRDLKVYNPATDKLANKYEARLLMIIAVEEELQKQKDLAKQELAATMTD